MMLPPRPPSPPSGPPAATNFSRWKLTAPSPPLPAWSQMVAISIKLVCAAMCFSFGLSGLPRPADKAVRPQKSRAKRSGSLVCSYRVLAGLQLDAALLAGLAHALETDGSVHQSEQGVIAALANVLTRHDVGAALPDQDVAGQNLLPIGTLHAQTLGHGVAAVLRAAYAFLVCHL